ncbi:Glutamine and serine-rich protein 1 [Triplophysa tibetana]|uniref:Glutamine and serine-rich protein 1 n=1 Tax=Triplophysa tibetana TaxID=1572043 RepID=A0A5A9NYN6_9TELE|nr:Glutamine and serine-rich protein 1 [Triplophysa tibetana]
MERNFPSSGFTEPVTAAAQTAGWAYKPRVIVLLEDETSARVIALFHQGSFGDGSEPEPISKSVLPEKVVFIKYRNAAGLELRTAWVSLAGWPALGRVLVVPNCFHLRMMQATVLIGTFNAAEIFLYPSPDLGLDTVLSRRSTDNSLGFMGLFDSSQQSTASSNTTESSVMNFLSTIESRGLQAGPAGSTLLPPFRSPSWQMGANCSTELFLTGALHPPGTFHSPSALPSYQHPSAFPTRSFTTTSALAVPHSTFTSSNSLLSPTDPLLQLKSSQSTVPTALAFNRLGGTSLGAALPPQSSTYRSAQESAPHLLQPQFSLLPAALGSSQQAPQPYGVPIFSGSIERALQRECSVIKHLQRPSSTQPVQEQMVASAQHSLQGYLDENSDLSYHQDPSSSTAVPCSPVGESVNGGTQQKTTSQVTLQLTQAYASTVSSPGFSSSSGLKVKEDSYKVAQHPSDNEDTEVQTSSPGSQQHNFQSPAQKQSSVIASQSQPYTSGMVSISTAHSYITSPSLTSNLSQTQAFSSQKLPSIYKTLSAFASHSEVETSANQSIVYSSSQPQELTTAGLREGYETQMQGLCMVSPSQSYSSSHSQVLPTISFYTQGPTVSIPSQNYTLGQSLTPITNFSPGRGRSSSSVHSTQDFALTQQSNKTDGALLQQKYLLSVQSSTSSSASQNQALSNDQSSLEIKSAYGKSEEDEHLFLSSKENSGELAIEDVQALQKGTSPQSLSGNEVEANNGTKNVVYVLSKMEDRHNTQSVIRSNSRSEEQVVGFAHLETTKDERMVSTSQQTQIITNANAPSDSKSSSLLMHSTHAQLSADQLKQHTLLLKHHNHQAQMIRVQQADPRQMSEDQTQFIRVPSAQVLLEPSHMIVLQQPVLTPGQNQPKQAMYMQSVPVQYVQMNSDTINVTINGRHNQQVVPHQVPTSESTKQNSTQKDFDLSNPDTKQNFTLNSVCFPESMLLADERSILSNVDDILAATAAACGVTPQDFGKSTSSDTDTSSAHTPTDSKCHFHYQQQEKMNQKLREVEEKQPEVKTGFLGSFLDFLKSGPRQHLSSPPVRTPSRTRKSSVSKRTPNPLLASFKPPPPSTPLMSPDHQSVIATKRLDEDLQRNLETLPSFSSDEDDSVGKNQDLQMSITSALSSLDEPADKKHKSGDYSQHIQSSSTQPTDVKPQEHHNAVQISTEELLKDVPPDKLAVQLTTVAIEGLMDDELSDSGGEGMYRERDEFVVKNEDIERLRITLTAGVEPPAIWKVQKALLQKFVPELRDGKRVFFATNSYLGYFGDAKSMYRRVHIKFLDTVNKREYVRVCSRKPRCKPMHSMRGSQAKALLAQRFTSAIVSDSPTQKTAQQKSLSNPRPKQMKAKAEPPPKKRKKWKEEFPTSPCSSSPEALSEDDEFTPPVPFASRFLNTRTMKETFKSFVELLISVALDPDVMNSLERENDELLLPHMKRVDGMITDNRRRLLPKLRMGQIFKNALDSFPELSVATELNTDCETPVFKVRLSGRAYNRKTMKPSKSPSKVPLEYTVDQQKTKWFSLYHSLQHYKFHTYLMCMEEIELLKSRGEDLGQEDTVQTCMENRAWVESLFDRFGELLTQVQQACL